MTQMKSADVVVIGAGPSGCATAIFLATLGWQVVLLDRAFFPRDKVCGEFISPAADALLDKMGVLSRLEKNKPHRLDGVAVSAYGGPELLIPYPPYFGFAGTVSSLSIERFGFDQVLVERARELGVEVLEGHQVIDLLVEHDCVVGVKGRRHNSNEFEIRSPLVIDAGGRNAISPRKLKLKKNESWRNRVALAAHWEGVHFPENFCYMHVSRPGYTGMSPTLNGGGNVVLVVDPAMVQGKDQDTVYQNIVRSNPRRRKFLEAARPREKVRAVGSLSYRVLPPPVGGLMLVGDAMGFIDPFTGEGIYLALRSAELAADCARQALKSGNFSHAALSVYETRRHREFHLKFALCRALQFLIYNKALCRQTVALLRKRPDLAAELVGVIGDYIPPRKVMSFTFLWELAREFFRIAPGPGRPGGNDKTPVSGQPPASFDRQK